MPVGAKPISQERIIVAGWAGPTQASHIRFTTEKLALRASNSSCEQNSHGKESSIGRAESKHA